MALQSDNQDVNRDAVRLVYLPKISKGYYLLKTLGHGSYGRVHQCLRADTLEIVAMKVVPEADGRRELRTLKALRKLDPDKNNMVRLQNHYFRYGQVLLEFEMLDVTLKEFVSQSAEHLPLSDIQTIMEQLLVALNALKSAGLVHADIKPNNIMLVNRRLQPARVKLIDFGVTTPVSKMNLGLEPHVLSYRAPEAMLGLPLTEAVDMWALGCILAYMYLGKTLYRQSQCKYKMMKNLVQVHGRPDDHMLSGGKYTATYFQKSSHSRSWRLKKSCHCSHCQTAADASSTNDVDQTFGSLGEITSTRPVAAENKDTLAFLSLLRQMLQLDPTKRITPGEALRHPFMTTKHFSGDPAPNLNAPSAPAEEDQALELNDNSPAGSKEPSDSVPLSSSDNEEPPSDTHSVGESDGSDDTPVEDAGLNDPQVVETSPASASLDPDGANSSSGIGSTDLIEVKTKKKYFRRVSVIVSRMIKPFLGIGDDPE